MAFVYKNVIMSDGVCGLNNKGILKTYIIQNIGTTKCITRGDIIIGSNLSFIIS